MMTKIKGMQDIQTLCGRAHSDRAVMGSRVQAVNELAYLEHAREQLERELEIWAGNKKRAQGRLQSVRQRITSLQKTLEMEPSAKRRSSMPERESADDSREARPAWRKVALEY